MKRFHALCSVISSLAILASLSLFLSNPALAQEDVLRPRRASTLFKPVTIGIEGGMNFNIFSQTVTQTPVIPDSWLNVLKSGSGVSPYAGIVIDLPLTSSIALQVKGTYDSKTFANKVTAKYDCPDVVVGGTEIVDVDVEYTITSNFAGVGLGLRVDATPNLFFTVGPIAHFLLGDATGKATSTITTQGSTCEWLDASGQRSGKVITANSTDSTYTSTRIGLEAGAGYKIPLTPSISLVPQLRFQYMFTKLVPDDDQVQIETTRVNTVGSSTHISTDAMLHSLQLGVALWFRL